MEKIGFIGIGLMGHGIAKNLAQKGHPLSFLVHRNRANIADLLRLNAVEVKTPAQLAQTCDIVMLCVTGTPQVEANVYGKDGLLEHCRQGQIVIDTSTAMPDSTDRIRADFEQKGVRFVDAPLSRTPQQAEEGKLNTMVGADEQTFARLKPVFEKFCENVFHVGGFGAGHKTKLVNNFMTLSHTVVACEALAMCVKAGLDPQIFYQLVSAGAANSTMFQLVAPGVLQGDFARAQFTLSNAKKDIGYYQQMAGALNFAGPLGATLYQVLLQANALGLGEKFLPSLVEAYEQINDLRVVPR